MGANEVISVREPEEMRLHVSAQAVRQENRGEFLLLSFGLFRSSID